MACNLRDEFVEIVARSQRNHLEAFRETLHHLQRLPVDLEVQDVREEGLVVELLPQRVRVDVDVLRILARAVYDPGHPPGTTRAAIRTLSTLRAHLRVDFKQIHLECLQSRCSLRSVR